MESPLQPTLLMLLLRCEDTFVLFKLRITFQEIALFKVTLLFSYEDRKEWPHTLY